MSPSYFLLGSKSTESAVLQTADFAETSSNVSEWKRCPSRKPLRAGTSWQQSCSNPDCSYFSKETSSNVSNHRGIIDIGLFFDFLRDFGNVSRKIFYTIRLRLRELRDGEVSTTQAT